MSLRSDGDVTSVGGRISATGALDIDAAGNVAITAAQVSNHQRITAGKATWESSSTVNHAALLLAGLDLSILAGGDLAVGGSKLEAGGDVTLTAGRDLTIAAMVDEQYSSYRNKKTESTLDTSRNRGSSILSTGGSVDAWAGDNLAVQASRVAAAGDVTLEAAQGSVALLSGTDSTFIHEKSEKKSLVWQSTRDKGESGTKVVMTELEAGGALSVAAGAGVVADYRASGDLQTSLAALAQDPRTAWVSQIASRNDVNWRAVNESYQSWDHKTQGLTPAASMIIAIAVAVATQGVGAGLVGATGTVTAAMANAGFSALVSQASVSLINNQGDLGKVLKELGSAQTVKNLAVAVATAGLMEGIAGTDTFKDLMPQGTDLAAQVGRAAVKQTTAAVVGTATDTLIQGRDFKEALRDRVLLAGAGVIGEVGALNIAEAAAKGGEVSKLVAHAALGCAVGGAAGGSCGAGAVGGVAGMDDVGTGAMTAGNAAENNALSKIAIAFAKAGAKVLRNAITKGKVTAKDIKDAGLDEVLDILDNVSTLANPDASALDKLSAIADLVIGVDWNDVKAVAKVVEQAKDRFGGVAGAKVADNQLDLSRWQETKDGKAVWKWPDNDGFKGTPEPATIKPGTVIDRYGDNLDAEFFAPVGTPLEGAFTDTRVGNEALREI